LLGHLPSGEQSGSEREEAGQRMDPERKAA